MEEFQSSFVPPRKFNFSRRRIDNLKTKAAEFLVNKFEIIHSHPGQATKQPWEHRERKDLTKWLLTIQTIQNSATWIFLSGKVT